MFKCHNINLKNVKTLIKLTNRLYQSIAGIMQPEHKITEITSNKMFGGFQKVFSHESKAVGCTMKFGVYLPPQTEDGKPLPVLYWLSGLTCTHANFIEKSGAQRFAAKFGIILVNPDTSPRGLNIPGDSDSWDFGSGASFYLNATQEPWKENYRMFDYVTVELLQLVTANFNVNGKQSIMGHSMGGHGAFICALKNPGLYQSVSAFAPICNPIECPWGQKAFYGYLGPMETGAWNEWDATELVKKYNGPQLALQIEQGEEDQFYKDKQLNPKNLMEALNNKISITLVKHNGYDHSYFFIASFIEEHFAFHNIYLK